MTSSGRQPGYSQEAVPVTGQTAGSNQGSTPGSSVLSQIATGSAELALELSDQDYSAQLTLSKGEQEELQWWVDHLSAWNGRTITTEKLSLVIESDASTRGWGASCEGIQTGGPLLIN